MEAGKEWPGPWFVASVARDSEAEDQNEDAWKLSEDSTLLALSDGAGESFDPGTWARILARYFVSAPAPASLHWLGDAIAEYQARHDREQMSWSGQAAFDRGSFATLLGVTLLEGEVEILAVGDSVAVLVDGEELRQSFPYTSANEFCRRPVLLSTNREANGLRDKGVRASMITRWQLRGLSRPAVLGMTDALGAWLLENPQERCGRLLAIHEEAAFRAFVLEERAAGRMRRDDTTLAVTGGW